MSGPSETIDDLRARVLAEVAKTPSPTRESHVRRSRIVLAIGAAATALVFFAMGGVKPGSRPFEMITLTVGVAFVAGIALLSLARPARASMLARPRSVLVTAAAAAAPLLALVAFLAASVWPGPASEVVVGRVHVACGAMTVVQGLLPLSVMVFTRRGSDPVHPIVSGAALGMAAGALAAMMAYARCPHAEVTHCLVAHVAPALLLSALGAALGVLVLRVREAR